MAPLILIQISANVFEHVLEFLYTGMISTRDRELMPAIKLAADSFDCEYLATICSNVLEGLDELNPSIGMCSFLSFSDGIRNLA
jgi:hypothetical protein